MNEWPAVLVWRMDGRGGSIVTTESAARYFSDSRSAERVVNQLTRPELHDKPAGNC